MKRAAALGLALALSACAAGRIENGVFYSPKGYQVTLPREGWRIEPGGRAELELRREAPPGGMLADVTCDGPEAGRRPGVLARHLTFGLAHRVTLENDRAVMGGREAGHIVVRGSADGAEVTVEAVVLKGQRCVYDFLYVAPTAAFESGRDDFKAFVGSFSGTTQ